MNFKIMNLVDLRQVEQQAEHEGVDLMARAAQATVDSVMAHYPDIETIWVAAGMGNNGGDALFAAHGLRQHGFNIINIMLQPPLSQATQQALVLCDAMGIMTLKQLDDVQMQLMQAPPDLIIDGLLGIGINRAPSDGLAALIELLNHAKAPILALDVPSGINAETGQAYGVAIHATNTLTFLGHKAGLWMADGADCAGRVELASLDDFAESAMKLLRLSNVGLLNLDHAETLQKLYRPRNSHKGRFGSVAVIGGHRGMLGATLLAGRAAFATGAGKVWLHVLDDRLAVDPFAPELMLRGALDDLSAADAIAVGMGLGQDDLSEQVLRHALNFKYDRPMVLDADALNLIAQNPLLHDDLLKRAVKKHPVLTPHPTEAARLLNISTTAIQADRITSAQKSAQQFNSIVILKGAGTVITAPDGRYRINTTGGAALAVAGQGDVLSGVILALFGMGVEPFEAASLAVYVHGLAGDLYTEAAGGSLGLTASATVSLISRVINLELSRHESAGNKKPHK